MKMMVIEVMVGSVLFFTCTLRATVQILPKLSKGKQVNIPALGCNISGYKVAVTQRNLKTSARAPGRVFFSF